MISRVEREPAICDTLGKYLAHNEIMMPYGRCGLTGVAKLADPIGNVGTCDRVHRAVIERR
jgi:hypothetical protein